jgi:hypothetical protein
MKADGKESHVTPKLLLILKGLHGVMSQKLGLFTRRINQAD